MNDLLGKDSIFRPYYLIQKHENCLKILSAIIRFRQRRKQKIESINGYAGTFPKLKEKYLNDIDTINKCINKLEQRYYRLINS